MLLALISFLANSNIWVALCALAFIEHTLIVYNISADKNIRYLQLFVFCTTYMLYNLHRFVALPQVYTEKQSQRHAFVQRFKKYISIIMVLLGIVAIYFFFQLHFTQGLILLGLGFIAIFYTFPIPLASTQIRLRDYGILKPYVIGFSWATVCTVLPLYNYLQHDTLFVLLIWLQKFLFATAITIPFDVRDIHFDKQNIKHATIPIKYGKLRTYWYAQALLMLSVIPLFIVFLLEQNIEEFLIPTILWYLITSNIIRKNLLREAKEIHYSFWLDGTIIFGYILFSMFHVISH